MHLNVKTLVELKAELKRLVGSNKIGKCLEVLCESVAHHDELEDKAISLSARYHRLENQEKTEGTRNAKETNEERNQINLAVLAFIRDLTEHDFTHLEHAKTQQEKLNELIAKVRILSDEKTLLSNLNRDYFQRLNELENIEALYKTAKEKAETAQNQLAAKEKELADLQKDANTTWQQEKAALEKARDEALKEAKALKAEKAKLIADLDAAHKKNASLEKELAALRPKPLTFTPPEMVFIKGGEFMMGDEEFSDAKPHLVALDDFYIGKYPVTVAQFRVFIEKSGYKTEADIKGGSYIWNSKEAKYVLTAGVNWECDVRGEKRLKSEENHPVIYISWNDVMEYCKWLSKETGKKYSLPSEAQWEYAARGGQNFRYAGSDNLYEVAWCGGNSGDSTHTVGEKKANGYGLYDMSGNVWEWCLDDWDEKYYEKSPKNNPVNQKTSDYKVVRGGAWYLNVTAYLRVSYRDRYDSYSRISIFGCRLVVFA